MKGEGITLGVFDNEGIQLEVPYFQRPYVWNEENWQTLLESVVDAPDGKMPFLGSLILQKKRGQPKCFYVIDGQQRLITLSILIHCFIRRFFPKQYLSSFSERMLADRTRLRSFVYTSNDPDGFGEVTRIIPSYADSDSFSALFVPGSDKPHDSKITQCAEFFDKAFAQCDESTLKRIYTKLISREEYLIAIWLGEEDDEQEIFDTVNSLGRKLANSDIIKNYLFQSMKKRCGDSIALEYYRRYWEPVFLNADKRLFWDDRFASGRYLTDNLDSFLKCFAIVKGIYDASKRGGVEGMAKCYKSFIDDCNEEELRTLIKELAKYANAYFEIKSHYLECDDYRISDTLAVVLLIMDKLEYTTFDQYILKLYVEDDPEKDNKLVELQRFVLKRFLWSATTKDYNKLCASLLKSDNPNAALRKYNAQTGDVQWDGFPSELLNIDNKNATLVLFLAEMIARRGSEDCSPYPLRYNFTLEHVMPVKWEKHWSDVPCYRINEENQFEVVEDPKDACDARNRKIHSIGNMLLLTSALNRKISNFGFGQKVLGNDKHKGISFYAQSLHVASDVLGVYESGGKWDERSIYEREQAIFNALNGFYHFSDLSIDEDSSDSLANRHPFSPDDPFFTEKSLFAHD